MNTFINLESINKDFQSYPYVITSNGIITDVNESFISLSEYSNNEILNKSFAEVWHNFLRIHPTADFSQNNCSYISCYMFTKSLNARQVQVSIHPLENSNNIIYIFDVQFNSVLDDKFYFLDQVYEPSAVGLAIYSYPEYILLKGNQNYIKLMEDYAYTREKMIGSTLHEFMKDWDIRSAKKLWDKVVITGKPIHEKEFYIDRFDFEDTYLDYNLTPIYEDNELKYLVLIVKNVTEFVKNKQALDEKNKMIEIHSKKLEELLNMKDEFLSIISHEFKTPLTIIDIAVQSINNLYRDQISDKVSCLVQKIHQNTYRQLRLVNNLLDITRFNSGRTKLYKKNMDIVLLTRLITESVAIYASQKGINLSFTSSISEKIMGIDDEKYERIILNLLSNAVKFTPRNKSILVKVYESKEQICVDIRDEGVGIPKEKQELIFERFGQVDSSLTRQAEGTGIGLSLVKTLVENLDGTITVKSALGKGSTFTVKLPTDKVSEPEISKDLKEISDTDNRLIKAATIEFSDVYLD